MQLKQIQKRSGESSMTPCHRENCRTSGKKTGKLKEIKNGANIVHPIPVFDLSLE